MKTETTITISIDVADLSRVEDKYLALYWHAAQANPAPYGDKDASELVAKLGFEIVARWLKTVPAELYHHQPSGYYWNELRKLAIFRDGEWVARTAEDEEAGK